MVDDQRSKRGTSLLVPLALGALFGLLAVLLVELSGHQPSPVRDVVGGIMVPPSK